ncbi:MAG: ABC transporter permease, partial [Bacteroidota bacterium]
MRIEIVNKAMFKNYLKIGWRNLFKSKGYSALNIGGLALGMATAVLIALWIHDELSYNTYHKNHDRIFKVMKKENHSGTIYTGDSHPFALAELLRTSYRDYFEHVAMEVAWTGEHIIASEEKKIAQSGRYMEPKGPEILTLNMLEGSRTELKDMNSIMISASLSKKLFGDDDPIGRVTTMDGESKLQVTGVYEDLPNNSDFHGTDFIVPFDMFYLKYQWAKPDSWNGGNVSIYVQTTPNTDSEKVSTIIKNVMLSNMDKQQASISRPEVFLHPMDEWHLYSEFENGVRVMSDALEFIWFYGIIGAFVLFLACINFVNLSTAKAVRRAKEVGIRKAIGSRKGQLIGQFLVESLLFATFAFVLSLGLVLLGLPWFNGIMDKTIHILWENPWFWSACLSFILFTTLLAGAYPAFYLSSFRPVKVLKGTFRTDRFGASPRKILVVFQFTVSISLIIGTLMIHKQILYVKERPIGYSQNGLLMLKMTTKDYSGKYDLIRAELLRTGEVAEVAGSGVAVTNNQFNKNGFGWKGKVQDFDPIFKVFYVTPEFGNTIGWQLKEGRDFSRDFPSDRSGVLINESAMKLMDLEDPVGETLTWEQQGGGNYAILGVVRDMVRFSPFEPVPPSIVFLAEDLPWIHIRINPASNLTAALPKIKGVFDELVPFASFDYKFVDVEYKSKFLVEERIGELAGSFALLAIFISCLGLFGLAAFLAEQRTKEIGIRKVLGASVENLCMNLSHDFFILVTISSFI